jgi:site-specific recombinase XerD
MLRHFMATQMIATGNDVRTVAGRLGHAMPSTTLDVYAHVMPQRDREVALGIGAALTD